MFDGNDLENIKICDNSYNSKFEFFLFHGKFLSITQLLNELLL